MTELVKKYALGFLVVISFALSSVFIESKTMSPDDGNRILAVCSANHDILVELLTMYKTRVDAEK